MILFLNFAPIQFMGGAEKWMNETAKKVSKFETSQLISTAPEIANIYGSIVLKRKFDTRFHEKIDNHYQITFSSFIPLSREWGKLHKSFANSRLIYSKFELLEMLIIIYFGGATSLKKTIAGIHSPFQYANPDGILSRLHNFLYSSRISSFILKSAKRVHVLNKKDADFMEKIFKLKNVVYAPNGATKSSPIKNSPTKKDSRLNILVVGELSKRKGTDILIKIIDESPEDFIFTIIGDGAMKNEIQAIENKTNVTYLGYIKPSEVNRYYQQNDVLLLPSRAESMSLALLEAIANGLSIVNSEETSLGLGDKIEYSVKKQDAQEYINTLNKLSNAKTQSKLNKHFIQNYFLKNFSSDITDSILLKKVFELNK